MIQLFAREAEATWKKIDGSEWNVIRLDEPKNFPDAVRRYLVSRFRSTCPGMELMVSCWAEFDDSPGCCVWDSAIPDHKPMRNGECDRGIGDRAGNRERDLRVHRPGDPADMRKPA